MAVCMYTYKHKHKIKVNISCLFAIEGMDLAYDITPEMSDFVWISSSVVFGSQFCLGMVTNLTVVFCYVKNYSVRW